MTSQDLYPLAQRLWALIPESLRQWSGRPGDLDERDRLANNLLMELTEVPDAPWPDPDGEQFMQAVIISETLAGFVTQWGCRYGNLDEEVDRATDNFILALGGTVRDRGVYLLAEGTLITVAAIAHLIGWVCILDVPEPGDR